MEKNLRTNFFKRNTALIHFTFWVLILHLLFDISGLYYSFREIFFEGELFMDDAFIVVPLMIGLFYWNTKFLIPRFLNRKSWWKYLIGITLSFFFCLVLGNFIYSLLENHGYHFEVDGDGFVDFSLFFYILTVAISTSLGVSKIAMQNSAKQKEAEVKQKEAELKFLTAQVNPHFLFNSLNTIYSLSAEEEANKTTNAVLKLSEIMRYPLKEGLQKEVPLESEIDFLKNFIELQKIRLGKDYPIYFEVKGEIENIYIAPLIFISFVENAFKYGISNALEYPIYISLETSNRKLFFKIKNTIHKKQNAESSGLGIENVRKRLDLIYPDQHQLEIKKEGEYFLVELKLDFE